MLRTFSLGLGAVAALALTALTAHADPKIPSSGIRVSNGRLDMVILPDDKFTGIPGADISNVIYLNRCSGAGCMVTGGMMNDAINHQAAYLPAGQYIVDEYQNNAHQTGAAADAEWNQLVQCVKEIYSPFNVMVTDVKPTGGTYSEAIVGGIAGDVGEPANVGGVGAFSCAPRDNTLSFTFANSGFYFSSDPQLRIWALCGVIGQETAHNFSLDHAYEFYDGTSTCNDPMTYRSDCGGQQFFRNKAARCGETEVRDCYVGTSVCGGTGGTSQNSHQKLLNVFGAGTSLIAPPTATITLPANGGTAIEQQVVAFQAGSKRGVEKSELYLNGWKWAEVKGAAFGGNGQLNPSNYSTKFPAGVPNGVIDIVIKSYDDLGLEGISQTVTVTKGMPCANAEADCAKGQKCEAGKCFWNQPTGQLGDSCDFPQFCESQSCVMTNEGGYCSQECIVGANSACPEGFDCIQNGSTGACLPADQGGCCSVGRDSNALWIHGGLSMFVLGLVVRRRRRQRNRL